MSETILSIVAYHVENLPSFNDHVHHDKAPCHKVKIISIWFREHDNELSDLQSPSKSPDLNLVDQLLGCGITGGSQHESTAEKSTGAGWCNHVNMEKNLRKMFTKSCLIHAMKNRERREAQTSISAVILTKFSVRHWDLYRRESHPCSS